jgi:hypothetical protein
MACATSAALSGSTLPQAVRLIVRLARAVSSSIVFRNMVFCFSVLTSSGRALRDVFLTRSALWPAAFLACLAHLLWITSLTSTASASTDDRRRGFDDEVVLDVSVTGWTFHVSHVTYVYIISCGIL